MGWRFAVGTRMNDFGLINSNIEQYISGSLIETLLRNGMAGQKDVARRVGVNGLLPEQIGRLLA